MAPGIIAGTAAGLYQSGSSGTIGTTYAGTVGVGNTLFALASWDTASGAGTASCADNAGNTWTQIGTVVNDSTNGQAGAWFVAYNATGGTPTVTVTLSASHPERAIIIAESAGLLTAAALDKNTGQANAATTTPTSGAVTTTTNGQYILGAVINDSGISGAMTAGTGFTKRTTIPTAGITDGIVLEDQIQTTAGSIAATWTQTSRRAIVLVATFKTAGGASITATGSISLSGTATGNAPAAATGTLGLTGTATGRAPATASGTISLTGTGTGRAPVAGSGSVTLTGTATIPGTAAGTGSITLTGTGPAQGNASATGSILLTGTAAARAPIGATGSISLAGAGTALAMLTATAALQLDGTAAVGNGASGTGDISLSGIGGAAGGAAGAGSIDLTGTAAATALITALGTLQLTGQATAGARAAGAGLIALLGVGAASGGGTAVGTGMLTLLGVGSANGPVVDILASAALRARRNSAALTISYSSGALRQ